MSQLLYSKADLLAEHAYARPQIEAGYRLHGGFDAAGLYISPRTLMRWPAVKAWQAALQQRGWPLIDASTRLLQRGSYPSFEQQKFLLGLGLGRTLWNSLTITGIVEARGQFLAAFDPPSFAPLVDDDIADGWVTVSSALLGFVFGTLLGIVLAVGIVHIRTLERSLMPWIIASQTIPILAIAPMIIVVLGSLGFVGLVPKAIISAYLCFFPVTIGMVKGLSSPEPIHLDLVRTYNATAAQTFWKLRWPSSMTFLFASLKVAVALAMVGAIVGELPTGAQAGLGARLLSGSYYGQTVQIWAALIVAAVLAALCVAAVGLAERVTLYRMGGQP